MNSTLKHIVEELVGLFVDDWAPATAVAAWVILIWFLHGRAPEEVNGTALLGGLVLIVLFGALRQARKLRSERSK